MKTLVLHIGMHKTGTTAIQEVLQTQRAELADHGVHSLLHDKRNHSGFVRRALGRTEERDGPTWGRSVEAARGDLVGQLQRDWRGTFVISGEGLSLLDEAAVADLKELVEPHVDETKVVVFVRPPRRWVTSMTQQAVRGHPLTAPESGDGRGAGPPGWVPGERSLRVPAYRSMVEPYLRAFGRRAVTLILYDRASFPQRCVVAAFLDAIGAPEALYERLQVAEMNPSISLTEATLLDAAHHVVSRSAALRADHAAWTRRVAGLGGPAFHLPPGLLEEALAAASEDVEWMDEQLGGALSAADEVPRTHAGDQELGSLSFDEMCEVMEAWFAEALDANAGTMTTDHDTRER